MKKQLLLSMLFGAHILLAQTEPVMQPGQTLPTDGVHSQSDAEMAGISVPSTVKTKFNTNYPNINATWEMDGTDYAAAYKDQGTNMGRAVVYDKNGTIVRTDSEVSNSSYPSAIADYCKANYPNEDCKVWQHEDNKGNKTYCAKPVKSGQIIYFDKNGKYVKTKSAKTAKK